MKNLIMITTLLILTACGNGPQTFGSLEQCDTAKQEIIKVLTGSSKVCGASLTAEEVQNLDETYSLIDSNNRLIVNLKGDKFLTIQAITLETGIWVFAFTSKIPETDYGSLSFDANNSLVVTTEDGMRTYPVHIESDNIEAGLISEDDIEIFTNYMDLKLAFDKKLSEVNQ